MREEKVSGKNLKKAIDNNVRIVYNNTHQMDCIFKIQLLRMCVRSCDMK